MAARKFQILRTDHTSFTVRNLDEALAFWRDLLGFELLSRHVYAAGAVGRLTGVPGSDIEVALLAVPGHHLELIEYLTPPPDPPARTSDNVGAGHVAFEVDDLDALLEALSGSGWVPGGGPLVVTSGRRTGQKAIYVRHPDGLTIEFIQP